MRVLKLLVFSVGFFAAFPASAAALAYQAKAPAYTLNLNAGEEKKVTFVFTNIGSKNWTGSASKTALYLYGNSSVFGNPTWIRDDLPAVINEKIVKPGQRATATFLIKAPTASGTYRERFLLSSAPNQWIKGSVASVTVNVKGSVAVASPPSAVQPAVTPPPASAPSVAASDAWKAELTDRGGIEWQLDPLGMTVVSLAFKNTGTNPWTRDGKNYISLYTGTSSRKSPFKDSSWKSDAQSVVLKEAAVMPGQTGHFELTLRAPETPGTYKESFQLAAENAAWIAGGTVTLPIRVTTPRDFIAKGVMNGVDPTLVDGGVAAATPSAGTYKAVLLLSSTKSVTLLGNGRLALTYGFKNVGTAAWGSMSLRVSGVYPALTGKLSSVRDESWVSATETSNSAKTTNPGEIGFIGFTLKAPTLKGSYTASFHLYADNQPVEDGTIDIPITVTADGYIEPEPTAAQNVHGSNSTVQNSTPALNPIPLTGDPSSLPNEPIIRVGLFATTDNQMVVRGVSGGFNLTESGNAVCTLGAGESVTVSYDRAAGVYRASGPRCTSQTTGVYVASAPDGISPLELADYSRPVSWLPGANDNTFRGKLELRYAKATDSVWVINELPIEWYLKGIGETSNSSPQEYQRALLTAARTYAMYHVQRGTKHADENYTIDAKYDQVYRGYGAEARDPAVVAAVDATRGQIVTYNGTLALTPYYSRSDGRTRSWTEVWGGGPYAWLVSVPVPWDNGKTLWGHGVGLSATGALGAAADGWTYDRILKYFYTSTELRRAYK